MNTFSRVCTPVMDYRNANLAGQYAIDSASWIWHPGLADRPEGSLLEFRLDFTLTQPLTEFFLISADNRYELYLDDEYVDMGPDRSDLFHWAFARIKMQMDSGKHTFRVRAWYYRGQEVSNAQVRNVVPGFVFAAESEFLRSMFNTGSGAWKVRPLPGVSFDFSAGGNWGIAVHSVTDLAAYITETPWTNPCVIRKEWKGSGYGCTGKYWRPVPSNLPSQIRRRFTGTIKVCCTIPCGLVNAETAITEQMMQPTALSRDFEAVLTGKSMVIPAHTCCDLLLDFGTYVCAYPEITVQGGDEDSFLHTELAESLVNPVGPNGTYDEQAKGNRNGIVGKVFPKMSLQQDTFRHFPAEKATFAPLWWRAGRYVKVSLRTGEAPFTLHKLDFLESRYPMEPESEIVFDDPVLNAIQPMMIRVLQMCMHETYMDCPYYEQMMYVGDSRLEMLTCYASMRDASMPRRALELFDWSRDYWHGLCSEQYPSTCRQLSSTFSALWPQMVNDYSLYRRFSGRQEEIRLRSAVRAMITALSEYVNEDGLIENLPGWSFVDWIQDEWRDGIPWPLVNTERSAIFSLHYLYGLRGAMDLEGDDPDNILPYYRTLFDRTARAVRKYFWVDGRGLFADDLTKEHFSIHGQCLALLAGVLPAEDAERCFHAMRREKDSLTMPTLYFIHYLFETLYRFGKAEEILDYTYIWKNMFDLGAVSTWEMPEPTRSDCHAWGSHLYYHFFSSIAGIRPGSKGFRTVSVRPALGKLHEIHGKMPHPDGMIEFSFSKTGNTVNGTITLPEGCTGVLETEKTKMVLHPGLNEF